nr:glycosyltransferase-like At2g41451 [Tanacetum cinerariifolium]
ILETIVDKFMIRFGVNLSLDSGFLLNVITRYREHVVWTDKDLKKKVMKKGILTRIHAPMVIMQGLKEAGVFGSLIESAQNSLSKDTTFSSYEISNNSSDVDDAVSAFSSRKIGKREPRVAVRNVLQAADTGLLAMPPLSAPLVDNIQSYL